MFRDQRFEDRVNGCIGAAIVGATVLLIIGVSIGLTLAKIFWE